MKIRQVIKIKKTKSDIDNNKCRMNLTKKSCIFHLLIMYLAILVKIYLMNTTYFFKYKKDIILEILLKK